MIKGQYIEVSFLPMKIILPRGTGGIRSQYIPFIVDE
jgi:hypothetical protein